MTATRRRMVVVDTSVLINLCHVRRLDILGGLQGFEFLIPPEVLEEIPRPEQRSQVQAALTAGWIQVRELEGAEELGLMAEFLGLAMGSGESAALALAAATQAAVACDELGRFRNLAAARLGPHRLVNTVGLVVLALDAGVIALAEADALLPVWADNRFRLAFASFGEVWRRRQGDMVREPAAGYAGQARLHAQPRQGAREVKIGAVRC